MNRLVEFAGNNPVLVGLFAVLVIALIVTEIRRTRRGFKEISAHELTRLINADAATVVDVNAQGDFEKGHIIHSRNHPHSQINLDHKDFVGKKDKQFVLVCRDGAQSQRVAGQLVGAGYAQVAVLRGGLVSWVQDSLPTEKGRK